MGYAGIDDWSAIYSPMMRALDGHDDPIRFDEDWDDEPDLLDAFDGMRDAPLGSAAEELGGEIRATRAKAYEFRLPTDPDRGRRQADLTVARRGVNPGRTDGGLGHLFDMAKSLIGTPYVFGAAGPNAFDCSGATAYLFERVFGVSLPHQALQQAAMTKKVSREDLRPGDLIFYRYGRLGSQIDHVEIYMGGGKQIGTSNPTEDFDIDPVDWAHFVQGGRVVNLGMGNRRDPKTGKVKFREVQRPVARDSSLAPMGLAGEEYGTAAFTTVLADIFSDDTVTTRKAVTPQFKGGDGPIKKQLYRGFIDAGRPDLARMVNTRDFATWIRAESGWRPGATSPANNHGKANDGLFQIWRGHAFNSNGQVAQMSPYEQALLVAKHFGHLTPEDIRRYATEIRANTYGGWG